MLAALSSAAITAVVTASIIAGMAGLPGHDHAPSQAASQLRAQG